MTNMLVLVYNIGMETIKKTPRLEVLIRYVQLAENLASEHPDGKLPSVTWLRDNDYAGLYQYMRAHPKPFSHLEQEVLPPRSHDKAIRQRQVTLARTLARRNNGVLRSGTRLTEHGHGDLASYMRRHPEFFEGISQERDKSTPEQHVGTAEKLARDNGGTLPGPWAIIKHNDGGWALYKYMDRKPHLFLHIPGFLRWKDNNETSSQCKEEKFTDGSKTIR